MKPAADAPPAPVRFGDAFLFWLKLGLISFGGPAGQIAIMHRELVENRRWISERRFLHALNYCMVLPGPEAQQLATYIGWLMHRTWGGIVAGTLFVLPSLALLILLSWLYAAHGGAPLVAGLLYGVKPAVTAIVVQATHRIGTRALRNGWLWGIAVGAFVAIAFLHLPFPLIVIAAGLLGAVAGRFLPGAFGAGGEPRHAMPDEQVPHIGDDTPTPAHARFRVSRLIAVIAGGLALWILPIATMTLQLGWQHPLTQMGWFFTKAALLTFGGAYAVLPYVYQGAVHHYHWLLPTQMIDGLALGETTPGPLIMIVAFVAFVGTYSQAIFGPGHLFLAGVVAAAVTTWFTFLPSFVFIFAGAPLIETTHRDLRVTAPLNAITAAVVGVIANLALFFAWHVLWPRGWGGHFDWISFGIAAIAALALLRYRRGVIEVIAVSAAIGLLARVTAGGL
jgi:chromate transporter